MATLVVSDLHLGAASGLDLALRDPYREALVAAASEADCLVLLGDILELRELPARAALERARPLLRALGEACADREIVVVPGNHDHALARPLIDRRRIAGEPIRAHGLAMPVGDGSSLADALAAALAPARVTLAYPGVRLRNDVYATHGHYLDLHLAVPKLESLAAATLSRVRGRGWRPGNADDHERALSPLYALLGELAELAPERALVAGGRVSRRVWLAANDARRTPLERARRLAVTGTVRLALAALRAGGVDGFEPHIDGVALRRGGLRAMARVAELLGVDDAHVLFGHTHRAGPLARDDKREWRLAGGGRLWNAGCWIEEPALAVSNGLGGYAPGFALRVPEREEPELLRLVRD